jgi:hypothetical protein
MTASAAYRSHTQLWSDLLVALGGSEASLRRHLSERQFLFEILDVLGGSSTTLNLGGRASIMKAIVVASGGSVSPNHVSFNVLLAQLVEALGGDPISPSYNSTAQLLAAAVNAAADTGGGGGGGDYTASAVHFEGVSHLIADNLVIADSPYFSFVFWFKVANPGVGVPGGSNYNPFGFNNGIHGSTAYMNIGSAPGDRSVGNDNDSSDFVQEASFDTSGGVFSHDQWVCCMSCMDMDQSVGDKINFMVLNDTVYLDTPDDFSDGPFNIAFGGAASIGAACGTVLKTARYIGDIADVWLAPGQFVDFRIEANRRKFIDALGKPVFLGANGELPTGVAPPVFHSGDATEFIVNKGSAGDVFSLKGAIRTVGIAGPGSVAAIGARVGMVIASLVSTAIVDLSADFESVISVDDQIQQSSSDDLSATGLSIVFTAGTLTNATTSPSD